MDCADIADPVGHFCNRSDLFYGVSLRNAHWVRLVPMDNPDGTVRWRLLDYNHGPAIADTDEWERER